jgi:hypothetical protein
LAPHPQTLVAKPWSLSIPVGIFHTFLGALLGDAVHRLAPKFAHLPLGFPTDRVLTVNLIWLTVMLSYALFLGFIRTQAADAIRMQNELDHRSLPANNYLATLTKIRHSVAL